MTELLQVAAGHQVLEIGTGRGYHTAVIAEIVNAKNVVTKDNTIERTHHGPVRFVPLVGDYGFESALS